MRSCASLLLVLAVCQPMLSCGLKPALAELVESLVERHSPEFTLDLQFAENRYPDGVEQHLFRILQEACENTLRHGQASKISLSGSLLSTEINRIPGDNDQGFACISSFELAGGDVKIDSHPATGTSINFQWAPPKT